MQRGIANPAALVYREGVGLNMLADKIRPALTGRQIDRDSKSIRAIGSMGNLAKKVIDNCLLFVPGGDNDGRVGGHWVGIHVRPPLDEKLCDIYVAMSSRTV